MDPVNNDSQTETADSSDSSNRVFTAANLLSLSRLPLAALTFFSLANGYNTAAVALFVAATITDFLDGYLARRLLQKEGRPNKWGVIFDPVADKLFAVIVLGGLLIYREFPIWLAGLIVLRDAGILIAGSMLLKGRKLVVTSSLPGKYYFASLAILLVSYLTMFNFGVTLFLPLTALLWLWSTISYFTIHKRAIVDGILPGGFESQAPDNYSRLRTALTFAISAVYFIRFLIDKPYLNW